MKIQIIEDDRALSDGIRLALRELPEYEETKAPDQQLQFVQSFTMAQAGEDFLREDLRLLILDVNLPDGSGYDYLKWLRERSSVPVLVLTANDRELDEVMSLTLGADDYMSKPFRLAVLRARIQALARRSAAGPKAQVYTEDGFSFDFNRLEFSRNGTEIQLGVNEQKLLRMFVENRERILTRNLLYDRLWSDGGEFVDENTLSVTVNRLRGKLESKKDRVSYIQTVYGQGYMWKKKRKDQG